MKQNQDFYDRWAKTYDFDENSTLYIDELYFEKFWHEIPRSNSPKKILEIGCGSGRHTQKLGQMKHMVSAIDLSSNMIDRAKIKCGKFNIKFEHGNFLEKDFSNHEFDFCISSLVFEHIENLSLAFAKVFEALKSGGHFYLSEIHPTRMQNGSGARFIDESGKEVRATSFAHQESDFEDHAESNGLKIISKSTIYGTKELANINPIWNKYDKQPMILIYDFQKL